MSIYLSLGHNSSAIYKSDKAIIGYETERLNRIKSSSQFPIDSINEIAKNVDIKDEPIYITHWFDRFGVIPECKYFDPKHIRSAYFTHTEDFTHHDAHAQAADNF